MEVQQRFFAAQFKLAEETQLPMFLHMRAAAADFCRILKENIGSFNGGVVHSFTGTDDELNDLLQIDNLAIGNNFCTPSQPVGLLVHRRQLA
eukprot:evm.model.scf_185.7 EVM.evm.TU.scf_185.7   scf_185:82840-85391(+)